MKSLSRKKCPPTGCDSEGEAVTTSMQSHELAPIAHGEIEQWYAVQTRSRHEKLVAQRFQEHGITAFLPLLNEVRRWSDRKKIVELPLFSCYVFAKIAPTNV